jgi:hypothetical protein
MAKSDKLLIQAERTVRDLWHIRPGGCIVLQNAIDRYKLAQGGSDRTQYLERVINNMIEVTA